MLRRGPARTERNLVFCMSNAGKVPEKCIHVPGHEMWKSNCRSPGSQNTHRKLKRSLHPLTVITFRTTLSLLHPQLHNFQLCFPHFPSNCLFLCKCASPGSHVQIHEGGKLHLIENSYKIYIKEDRTVEQHSSK